MDRITTFSNRIKEYRETHNMTLADIEARTGVPAQTINRYELSQRSPKIDVANDIAEKLGVNALWLQGYDVPEYLYDDTGRTICYFPVIGSISAGYDNEPVMNYTDETIPIPAEFIKGHKKDDFFVLNVTGNSMYPQLIPGDKVLVRRCASVDSGDTAIVLYNGEDATIKKVRYSPGEDWLELVPVNPEYATRRIEGADLKLCRVQGKVIKLIRDV